METDVLVVGGGLSGLALADGLFRAQVDFRLVEARGRFGGRIETVNSGDDRFDLGPAWFWPGQPRLAAMVTRFGLQTFEQHHEGILTFEDETGSVERGRGFASMQGSWRLAGGMSRLADALVAALPEDRLHRSTPVVALAQAEKGIRATSSDGMSITARRVVLALPPRIAAHVINFTPALPNAALSAMSGIATWMAGQAKAVAVYDTPFWRAEGLSGDAMSRFGPLVEIHDASPVSGAPGALFGFIGLPPQARTEEARLRQQVLAQLDRLFGPSAAEPRKLLIRDWATEPFTATPEDAHPLFEHPRYGLPDVMTNLMEGCLIFAGTEVATGFGGYLEGALEAAENALAHVLGTETGAVA